MGDSGQYFGGWGYHNALSRAMVEVAGSQLYGTSLRGENDNNGNGFIYGLGWDKNGGGFGEVARASSGAPASLLEYEISMLAKNDAVWVDDGATASAWPFGMAIYKNGHGGDIPGTLDQTGAFTFEFHHGLLDPANYTNDGEFRPIIRELHEPNKLAQTSLTSAMDSVSAGTIARLELDLPADSGRSTYDGIGSVLGGGLAPDIKGPFLALYSRAIQTDRTFGFIQDSLVSLGGEGVRFWANEMVNNAPDTGLEYFLGEVRRPMAASAIYPRVCVVINLSAHDRGESNPSVGPQAVSDGDSAEAYEDNLTAMIQELEARWAALGNDPDELCYLLIGHFPGFNSAYDRHPTMEHFHGAARSMANGAVQAAISGAKHRIGFVDPTAYLSLDEMSANGWYNGGGSGGPHLTREGYDVLYARTIDRLLKVWK